MPPLTSACIASIGDAVAESRAVDAALERRGKGPRGDARGPEGASGSRRPRRAGRRRDVVEDPALSSDTEPRQREVPGLRAASRTLRGFLWL